MKDSDRKYFDHLFSQKLELTPQGCKAGDIPMMYVWEKPLMKAFSEVVAAPQSRVLEIGFGMGICASYIQDRKPAHHTIIEAHPEVLENLENWKRSQTGSIEVIGQLWQDVLGDLHGYDGIMFDAHSAEGSHLHHKELLFQLATGPLLNPGGVLAFFTYRPYLQDELQSLLFTYFDDVRVRVVRDLEPTEDIRAHGIEDRMLVPYVVKKEKP